MTRLADSAYPHRLPAFFCRLCCPAWGNLSRQNAATVATLSEGVLQFWLPSAPQRYNTLDFLRESRMPRMALPSFGNLLPKKKGGGKRCSPLDTPCQQGAARPYWKPRAKGILPFGYPVIFSQMVLTQKNCVFPCPTIFRKCHSTCSLFLLKHCKNFKLCRDVTSKNSVFSHMGILSPHCCGRDGNASK